MAKLAVLVALVLVGCGGYSEFDDASSSELLNETGGVTAVAVTQDVVTVGGATWTSTAKEAVGGADVADTTAGFGGESIVVTTTGGVSSTGGASTSTGGSSVSATVTAAKGGTSAVITVLVPVKVDCSSQDIQLDNLEKYNPDVTCLDYMGNGTCVNGACSMCPYDRLDCDGDPRNGCEVLRDDKNCSQCGDVCGPAVCYRFGSSPSDFEMLCRLQN